MNKASVKSVIINKLQSYSMSLNIDRRELLYHMNYTALCDSISWMRYPVLPSVCGGGANASFLYLLINALLKIKPTNIVELGCGQTTRLLSQYAESDMTCNIQSVDHDDFWINTLRQDISEKIDLIHAPMVNAKSGDLSYQWYQLENKEFRKIQLLIVDGPPAYAKSILYNRYGAINLVDAIDKDNFAIILDDADRKGERRLVDDMLKRLPAGTAMRRIYGVSTQSVMVSSNNMSLLYL